MTIGALAKQRKSNSPPELAYLEGACRAPCTAVEGVFHYVLPPTDMVLQLQSLEVVLLMEVIPCISASTQTFSLVLPRFPFL